MIWIITLTAFCASILTLFSGFGLGTLLMPVIAMFFPISVAVALTALVHLLNNLFKLIALWKAINWRVTLKFGIPALLASVVGAWLLTSLEVLPELNSYEIFGREAVVTPVKLAIGILLIGFALAEWFSIAKQTNISEKYLPFGGVFSGFFGGLSGHQGAFRSAFLLHAGLDKNQFVATNAAIASLVDIARLAVYGINLKIIIDQISTHLIVATATAAFAGVIVGKIWLHKVTIISIQRLIALLLLVLGALIAAGVI